MKKLFKISVVAVFGVLAFASCSVSVPTAVYYCVCNYVKSGVVTNNDTVLVTPSETQSTAKTQCANADSTLANGGATNIGCGLHK